MIHSTAEYLQLIAQNDEPGWHRLQWEAAPLEVLADVLTHYPEFKRVVAANKLLDASVMRVLARDEDPQVRSDIASKNSLPDDLFYLLAQDADESVRSRIVYNKNAPIELLHQLKEDVSEIVVQAVKNRLSAPFRTGKIVNPIAIATTPKSSDKATTNLKQVSHSGTFTPQTARAA
ncbi:MAG: hypothetical protein ACAI35_03070 [Candidatus Methylacidiphilales bacterium]|nr:hypothetical protein [Candidatus Methylacidiphilales bacterium]